MTVYTRAPAVEKIAQRLIEAHHSSLTDARIEYVFRDKASKAKGSTVWGKARKVSGLNAYLALDQELGEPEDFFVIEIAHDIWVALDATEREALVDHELSHCKVVTEFDEKLARTVVTLQLVGHDCEEFEEIIRRHGLWRGAVRGIVKAAHEHTQLTFADAEDEDEVA